MTFRSLAVVALGGCVSIPVFQGPGGDDVGPITNSVVFVTSTTLVVPTTGTAALAQADALCAERATDARLPGRSPRGCRRPRSARAIA